MMLYMPISMQSLKSKLTNLVNPARNQPEARFELPRVNPSSLISYLKKYRRQFIIQAAGGILYNTVIVAGPILLGKILDAALSLEQMGVSPARVRTLLFYATAFLLVTVLFQYCRYIKRWYLRDMSNRITGDMRAGLLNRTLSRPMAALDRESVGDLMSRSVGDVEQIVSTVQVTINEGWDTWLLMISYLVVLFIYDYRITLICSIPVPFAILVAETVRHPLYQLSLKSRQAAAIVNSHLQKTLNGLTILRLFGREEVERDRLAAFSRNLVIRNVRTNLLEIGMMPVYATLASLGVIGVIGLGGSKVVNGGWTIGAFTAYLTMFAAMAVRTWVAARVFNRFHTASASWARVKEKLAETPSLANDSVPPKTIGIKSKSDAPYLQVNNLSFSFPGAKQKAIQDISFRVKSGDLVGVTGPVGSGKSALATVLTGLYPYHGEILVNGRDLSRLSSPEKTAAIAYSGQEAFLFSASIGQNITFKEKLETEAETRRLDEAVQLGALADDLVLFPQGLDTMVEERGVRLSGGQRQRVALARAIFSDSPILILDDPFSAVDIGTERRIITRMREGLKGKTIFIFSHRLAAFPGADKILVLDKGRLAEAGGHEELMKLGGIYQKIYSAQMWLEREGNEPKSE